MNNLNNLNNIIPKNNMNRWNEQEDIDLVHELKMEMTFENIAIKHQRTPRAIKLRVSKIIKDKIRNGNSKQQVSSILNIPINMINNILIESNEFEKEKQKKTDNNNNNNNLLEKKIKMLEDRIKILEENNKKIIRKIKNICK